MRVFEDAGIQDAGIQETCRVDRVVQSCLDKSSRLHTEP